MGALGGRGSGPLFGFVGPAALLFARLPGRRGRDADGVTAYPSATKRFGQPLELVGGFVDRLKVALMLVLPSGRSDVRMPLLGHPAPGQLHVPLIERRLELQEEK